MLKGFSSDITVNVIASIIASLVLLAAGLEGAGALMVILHAVMLPAMFVAMLLRRDEYSSHHGAHAEATA